MAVTKMGQIMSGKVILNGKWSAERGEKHSWQYWKGRQHHMTLMMLTDLSACLVTDVKGITVVYL